MSTVYLSTAATFSDCRTYRYFLTRVWGHGERRLVVVGLNPSTADEQQDDPTIRRCVGFAKREGCDGLIMVNLFAVRATDPAVMKAHREPVGPLNDLFLRGESLPPDRVCVAAWGVHGAHRGRGAHVAAMLPGLLCFGHTKDGAPKHPLYLPASAPLVPFRVAAPTRRAGDSLVTTTPAPTDTKEEDK